MKETYSSYLRLAEMLALQKPKSEPPQHDETLFIIIHQVYELWFKLLLHEFEKLRADLSGDRLFEAIATLKRCRMVMKTLVAQLDVLETMSPMSFLSFRDRLEESSGFQSAQFRELEFLLGIKRRDMLVHHAEGTPERARLETRLAEPSVHDGFLDFLAAQGQPIPEEARSRHAERPVEGDSAVEDAVLSLYKNRPEAAILLELLIDFDEGLQEWRYRHVKMVERTIGNKKGTGGSPGVEFLKKSLFRPIFPDLWAVRHRL